MKQKSISGRDLSKTLTSEDLLGKDVIDFDSTIIGVVEKVLIDPKTLDFVGISIDKGFLKKGITIGRNYIEEIKEHAVFLKIRVSYEVKGKKVFDSEGKIIGKVSSLELYENMNKIVNLIVKEDNLLFPSKEILISSRYIKTIGENVMLSIKKEDLKN
ncbi:MAG: PRC-barrel domain-containing protein [Candidatus Pacearchaeota archaeon]